MTECPSATHSVCNPRSMKTMWYTLGNLDARDGIILKAFRINNVTFTGPSHRVVYKTYHPGRLYGVCRVCDPNIKLSLDAKVAFVAPDPEKRGVIEKFANCIDTGIFRIFSEPEDAMTWMNRTPYQDDLLGPLTIGTLRRVK